IGQRVAAKGVTVLDDGTIADRRGSLNVDDEGNPSQRNVLIDDGILRGYIQDSLNARLMGVAPTGNGRRESYAHIPMPRMTNTYMLGGDRSAEEIVASIEKGLYATNFGGGQVDITSGKFVFSASESYIDVGRDPLHRFAHRGYSASPSGIRMNTVPSSSHLPPQLASLPFGELSNFLRSALADEDSRILSEGMQELALQAEAVAAGL